MQSGATRSTPCFTHPQGHIPADNHQLARPLLPTRPRMIQPNAKPIQSTSNRDFHLDTFFNPVWMSGPHVFSFAQDGRIVRPETYQAEPYPGYRIRAASSLGRGTARHLSSPFSSSSASNSRPCTDIFKPSARIEKRWKDVAIAEQDNAEFPTGEAGEKVRMQAEARDKPVGLVYTWPPKPQAAACGVLAGPRCREAVGTVTGPEIQVIGTDTHDSGVPALSYGSSGESESESGVFKVVPGRRVCRRRNLCEKYVGFGRVAQQNGSAGPSYLKADDGLWNPLTREPWVEDELTVKLKAILRLPD